MATLSQSPLSDRDINVLRESHKNGHDSLVNPRPLRDEHRPALCAPSLLTLAANSLPFPLPLMLIVLFADSALQRVGDRISKLVRENLHAAQCKWRLGGARIALPRRRRRIVCATSLRTCFSEPLVSLGGSAPMRALVAAVIRECPRGASAAGLVRFCITHSTI